MSFNSIEGIVRHFVHFTKEGQWNRCVCPICHDYKARGGFNFDNGLVSFNCFNCGYKVVMNETDERISDKAKNLLVEFNVPEDIIIDHVQGNFFKEHVKKEKRTENGDSRVLLEIELPPSSYKLTTDFKSPWDEIALEYLKSRNLSLESHNWYVSEDKKFRDRLIIPFYQNKKIIYWQARALDSTNKNRYLNAEVPKSNVIFNHDLLYKHAKYTFITEGVFDAISFNCVSLIGSSLPKEKLEILTKFPRRNYVFVIDWDKVGIQLGEKVVKLGYAISYLNENFDLNSSSVKYGKLWTAKKLVDNIKTGLEAEIQLSIMKSHVKCK